MRRLLVHIRNRMAVLALLVALAAVSLLVSACTEDKDPVVYYGPPPADISEGEDGYVVYYGPQPSDPDAHLSPDGADVVDPPGDVWVPDGTLDDTEEPRVYYGPPPTDVVEDMAPEVDEDALIVFYGPPPTDAVDDALGDVDEDAPPIVFYGPPPTDWVEEDAREDAVEDDGFAVLYGPMPMYGPPEADPWESPRR